MNSLRPLRNKTASLAQTGHLLLDPPLAILQPHNNLGVRIHLDPHALRSLDLSRKIYAVRDAFRDIVANATTVPPAAMTLATICATILGDNMPDPDSSDELYDAVPLHHRGSTLVAHALAIIHDTCPRHPTLLSLLLDVVLAHRLPFHANTLLHSLLLVATHPNQNSQCPVAHPAHSAFFVDLRHRWVSAGLPHSAFLRVFLDVMHTVQNPHAWSSKASRKLARTLSNDDLIHLLTGCADFVSLRPSNGLEKQLSNWINLASCKLDSSDAVLDFLTLARSRKLHLHPHTDLSSAVVRLATQSLPFQHSALALLQQVSPRTHTYSTLVEFLYTTHSLDHSRASLHTYAHALRSSRLLHLEASLWGCALRHIENPEYERLFAAPAHVKVYRQQLIDLVDDAEKRCFGMHLVSHNGWEWEPAVACWAPKVDDHPPKKKRRTTDVPPVNFASLLADSLSNRTVLHPRPSLSTDSESDEDIAPSDDILDLFAYNLH